MAMTLNPTQMSSNCLGCVHVSLTIVFLPSRIFFMPCENPENSVDSDRCGRVRVAVHSEAVPVAGGAAGGAETMVLSAGHNAGATTAGAHRADAGGGEAMVLVASHNAGAAAAGAHRADAGLVASLGHMAEDDQWALDTCLSERRWMAYLSQTTSTRPGGVGAFACLYVTHAHRRVFERRNNASITDALTARPRTPAPIYCPKVLDVGSESGAAPLLSDALQAFPSELALVRASAKETFTLPYATTATSTAGLGVVFPVLWRPPSLSPSQQQQQQQAQAAVVGAVTTTVNLTAVVQSVLSEIFSSSTPSARSDRSFELYDTTDPSSPLMLAGTTPLLFQPQPGQPLAPLLLLPPSVLRVWEKRAIVNLTLPSAGPRRYQVWCRFTEPPSRFEEYVMPTLFTLLVLALVALVAVVACLQRRQYEQSRRAAVEADAMRGEAEGAERSKSCFVASMTHELRTPMLGIIGMLDVLSDSCLSDNQLSDLSMARSSALKVLKLVNQVLDLSKLEAGRLQLETGGFDVRAWVEGEVARRWVEAQERNVHLAAVVDASVPQQLVGDQLRLAQALSQVMDYALSFTPHGGYVLVRVAVADVDVPLTQLAQWNASYAAVSSARVTTLIDSDGVTIKGDADTAAVAACVAGSAGLCSEEQKLCPPMPARNRLNTRKRPGYGSSIVCDSRGVGQCNLRGPCICGNCTGDMHGNRTMGGRNSHTVIVDGDCDYRGGSRAAAGGAMQLVVTCEHSGCDNSETMNGFTFRFEEMRSLQEGAEEAAAKLSLVLAKQLSSLPSTALHQINLSHTNLPVSKAVFPAAAPAAAVAEAGLVDFSDLSGVVVVVADGQPERAKVRSVRSCGGEDGVPESRGSGATAGGEAEEEVAAVHRGRGGIAGGCCGGEEMNIGLAGASVMLANDEQEAARFLASVSGDSIPTANIPHLTLASPLCVYSLPHSRHQLTARVLTHLGASLTARVLTHLGASVLLANDEQAAASFLAGVLSASIPSANHSPTSPLTCVSTVSLPPLHQLTARVLTHLGASVLLANGEQAAASFIAGFQACHRQSSHSHSRLRFAKLCGKKLVVVVSGEAGLKSLALSGIVVLVEKGGCSEGVGEGTENRRGVVGGGDRGEEQGVGMADGQRRANDTQQSPHQRQSDLEEADMHGATFESTQNESAQKSPHHRQSNLEDADMHGAFREEGVGGLGVIRLEGNLEEEGGEGTHQGVHVGGIGMVPVVLCQQPLFSHHLLSAIQTIILYQHHQHHPPAPHLAAAHPVITTATASATATATATAGCPTPPHATAAAATVVSAATAVSAAIPADASSGAGLGSSDANCKKRVSFVDGERRGGGSAASGGAAGMGAKEGKGTAGEGATAAGGGGAAAAGGGGGEGMSLLAGLRIMVVDDAAVNLLVARRTLTRSGATVATAGSGEEAVRHVKHAMGGGRAQPVEPALGPAVQAVDVVLMDLQMPLMDGFAATASIRAHEQALLLHPTSPPEATARAATADAQSCTQASITPAIPRLLIVALTADVDGSPFSPFPLLSPLSPSSSPPSPLPPLPPLPFLLSPPPAPRFPLPSPIPSPPSSLPSPSLRLVEPPPLVTPPLSLPSSIIFSQRFVLFLPPMALVPCR
ncbi:unnamed protein product [Closterium sp. Naga37s-1]|nr:unnamed protein product [Closterium sp. Naga37s-1]